MIRLGLMRGGRQYVRIRARVKFRVQVKVKVEVTGYG